MLPLLFGTWLVSAGPTLSTGDELIYTGLAIEECSRIDSPYRRQSDIEVRYFTMSADNGVTVLAALTLVKPKDDAGIVKVAVEVNGASKETARNSPVTRLEFLRFDRTGCLMIIHPAIAPPPLEFQNQAKIARLPAMPIDCVNPCEIGPLPDSSLRWTLKPPITLNGAQVIERATELASETWHKPSLTDRPWRRTERIWFSPADGITRVLWRRVERTDGPKPAYRTDTRLDLQSTQVHRNEGYLRIKREIEFAWWFSTQQAVANPDALTAQIRRYCEDYPATPYREAVKAVARRLEK